MARTKEGTFQTGQFVISDIRKVCCLIIISGTLGNAAFIRGRKRKLCVLLYSNLHMIWRFCVFSQNKNLLFYTERRGEPWLLRPSPSHTYLRPTPINACQYLPQYFYMLSLQTTLGWCRVNEDVSITPRPKCNLRLDDSFKGSYGVRLQLSNRSLNTYQRNARLESPGSNARQSIHINSQSRLHALEKRISLQSTVFAGSCMSLYKLQDVNEEFS